MAWLVLVLAGGLEAVWAVALGTSDGSARLTPTSCSSSSSPAAWPASAAPCDAPWVHLVCRVRTLQSVGLPIRLPIGTAYAVWVGIGAAPPAAFGMVTGDEPKIS